MSQEQRNRRQALLVLGMHRSGTSALTRVLNLHGVPLGSDLPEAAFDNEAGFWENQHFVRFHERLLSALNSSWDDPRELREDWLHEPQTAVFLDELMTLIASEFGETPIWAVKDPRLCRLFPLWSVALARLNIQPKLIFAMRDPAEVVGSLIHRNGLSAASASLIWLRHLVEPVKESHGLSRCVVDYNDLLSDWRFCMSRMAADLEIDWPVSSAACAIEVDAHLRGDLRHQRRDRVKDLLPGTWSHPLFDIYETSREVAWGQKTWSEFEGRLNAMMVHFEFVRPLIADLHPKSLRDQLSVKMAQLEQVELRQAAEIMVAKAAQERLQLELAETRDNLNGQNERLIAARGEIVKFRARIHLLEEASNELQMIKASRSWRLTRPLRVIARMLRHRGVSNGDRAKLQHLLQRKDAANMATSSLLPDARDISNIRPASQMPNRPDFFVWSVIDWHFRIQRPQHLSRELAASGHRVFYISNLFVDHAEPGFVVEPLDNDGRLFRVQLHLKGSPAIYHAIPTPDAQEQLRIGVGKMLAWACGSSNISLIQHPYWLETARILPNQRIVYDCMDHHGGFADNSPEVLARETDLMRTADLLVVTSDWLYGETAKQNSNRLIVRNACQYEHFAHPPEETFKDHKGRRVIGYYGAIAEWFDLDLLEKIAQRFNDCLVLMVGADTAGAQQRLRHLPNIQFTGEVPYSKLPFYLYGFDVCLLPFQVIPLTLATNPVKVYEYLSAGKEVVSILLPEIRQFGDLVRTAIDHPSFVEAVGDALAIEPDTGLMAKRRQFAAEQTWVHRVHDLVEGIAALPEPRVSVIVVTYNNLELTKACLHSLESHSAYSNLEMIVVDNASADDTPAYLKTWVAADNNRRVILNTDNRGFAAANNQGLEVASGDYLVLLNNDTYVTPGWIATLMGHLRRSKTLGLIGPVTNNIGNEARIDIAYNDMDEMLQAAFEYTAHHVGMLTPLRTAAFFCVMLPRYVYEKVGSLDESFGTGFFEDDDYCRRVEQAGWNIACADDVFVHHNLSASFNKLKQEKRQALFEKNRAIYEAKWGVWEPHGYRGER